jgi:hypothetical protein
MNKWQETPPGAFRAFADAFFEYFEQTMRDNRPPIGESIPQMLRRLEAEAMSQTSQTFPQLTSKKKGKGKRGC